MLTKSGLQIGAGLPQVFLDGSMDLALIERVARRAEDLGFDDLWVVDQTIGRAPILESITLLSYVAALTSTVRLGTSVLITNLHNPVQLAKALSSLDHLSKGRLIAGIGLGTDTREYAAFGVPEERRVARFVEGVSVMRALWTQPEARHEGPNWHLDGVAMEPKPYQRPSIPLWFGARAPAALRRAVELGDGWMGAGSTSIAGYLDQLAQVRKLLADRGRSEASFPLSKRVYIAIDNDRQRARGRMREWLGAFYGDPDFADQWAVMGTPDDVLTVLTSLRDAGASHLLLNPVFDYEKHLELMASELAPAL